MHADDNEGRFKDSLSMHKCMNLIKKNGTYRYNLIGYDISRSKTTQ